MQTDRTIERVLENYARNYIIANTVSEQFKTDRAAQEFIDSITNIPKLQEHYQIRYEQFKDERME